jgi:hypothetical protein
MAVTITDKTTHKRLVSAGNDVLFYEDIDVAGSMIELPAATGDIDTSDQLVIFEAYQKVFVINGAKLKVADFKNIKLTHTALTTAHANGDILTQASSDALMVVDFTNATKTATYGFVTGDTWNVTNSVTGDGSGSGFTPTAINGMLTHATLATAHAADDTLTQASSGATMVVEYTNVLKTQTWGKITGGTFNTANSVTGSGSGTAFTPTATDTSPPLWYDYTVYPGGASGALPSAAYIGCLFLGSIWLAGDPDYPNQWYKSRQTNPWDYAYISLDAQSATAGGNPNIGEIGDIIRALAPYSDDYLVIGCASSMWYMVGDPAAGGKPYELDLTVGMFGAKSWCLDGVGELYFWGTNGLYKTTVPGKPECISEIPLPDLVKDEDANPTSHRITMAFDRKRNAVLICITKLSDGTNSNYFYSVKTEGLFPESYPEECGVYSLFYYAANDNDYKDLLIGCKDGYIRKFDASQSSDDIGGSNEAIDSYITFGPLKLGNENQEGILSSITAITTGSRVGTALVDSSALVCKIWTSLAPDDIVEKFLLNTLPTLAATITAPGRNRGGGIRRPVRGMYAGVRLGNNTTDQTWGLENIVLEGGPSGKVG